MSDAEPGEVSAIWARWFEAFSRIRQLPLERMEHGWWIDVGKPQQSGRYILRNGDLALLQHLADTITDPAVHFELPVSRFFAKQVLPPGWALGEPEFLMTAPLALTLKPALPARYQFLLDIEDTVIHASCIDEDGHALSRGVCVIDGRDAIFDQIVTERSAQRQGLASAIMGVLTGTAAEFGATGGTLVATAEGRGLYSALRWTVLAEVSKAISPSASRASRHLRIVSRH